MNVNAYRTTSYTGADYGRVWAHPTTVFLFDLK